MAMDGGKGLTGTAGLAAGGATALATPRALAVADPIAATPAVSPLSSPVERAGGPIRHPEPGLPSHAAEPGAATTTTAKLSSGAELLLALLASARKPNDGPPATGMPSPGGLLSSAPLLSRPTIHANELAAALKTGIEHSGLFYESHLADWVGGERALSAIRAEPQAAQQAALPAIVSAQLDHLYTGQLRWQGELWPGMPVELQLQRDAGPASQDDRWRDARDGGHQAADKPPPDGCHWQARLITRLPSLGMVSALFTLHAEQLDVKLACAQPESAGRLQAEAARLAAGLQAAGLQLSSFASHREPAGDPHGP